jgi:hypothetical protein
VIEIPPWFPKLIPHTPSPSDELLGFTRFESVRGGGKFGSWQASCESDDADAMGGGGGGGGGGVEFIGAGEGGGGWGGGR